MPISIVLVNLNLDRKRYMERLLIKISKLYFQFKNKRYYNIENITKLSITTIN